MNWARILQNDPGPNVPLRDRIDALFNEQRKNWPALRDGEAALDHLEKKTLVAEGQSIVVQMNPARRRSTQAKTDALAVVSRACFLCPENMPLEERGVAFEDLVLLPNPYPVLPLHCTIASREHRPQQIAGRVVAFLRLARAIGPDLAALYNGPRCGASAPDHFHFQCARAHNIPILHQLPIADDQAVAHTSFSRKFFSIAATDAAQANVEVEQIIRTRRREEPSTEEPMFNLLAHFDAERYNVLLFPRAAHRPACYFATGADRIRVSPAILEMCGIMVVTEPQDFDRIDADIARAIYEEVSVANLRTGGTP
jgi:hypothetical protein